MTEPLQQAGGPLVPLIIIKKRAQGCNDDSNGMLQLSGLCGRQMVQQGAGIDILGDALHCDKANLDISLNWKAADVHHIMCNLRCRSSSKSAIIVPLVRTQL